MHHHPSMAAQDNDPLMETTAPKDDAAAATSPVDRRQAPLLLFDYSRDTTTASEASDGDADADFIFYSIPKKQLLAARSDAMRDHHYWITPQGWLLMAAPAGSPETFLWDPFTGRRVALPPDSEGFLKAGDGRKRCLLSRRSVNADDPASCLVLVVDLTNTVLWHCRLGGDGRWLRHEYEPAALGESRDAVLRSMSAHLTSVDGKFFMDFGDNVVTLELSPEGPVFSVFPVDEDRSSSPPCTFSKSQLVESGGDLFHVWFRLSDMRGRFVAGIGVSKLNLSARAWVKAESLGGRAFVVIPRQIGASLDPEEVGLKGDCIYYCMAGDKALHVYDMERGTTTLHNPFPFFPDHCSPYKVLMLTC